MAKEHPEPAFPHGLQWLGGAPLAAQPAGNWQDRPSGRPAVIELRSAFQPPVAASKVSVPAQLLEDMELGAEMQKKLIRRFEKKRARPSGQALSVWC
jgi:hypothetical protein